ncbi:CCR4-NOT transcription complex subunit 6-like [Microplitis mediator]|uniref:CCR4-NOT transcription complex subunit 6-like n=1 Tax=Microplitis mediator TaxID=375433 RepID=UPI002557ADBC|nr:CCR4-NOT transcription complex subunit 6-like [Microplitis mediator]
MIGRADIEGSKSDVAMNAWPPQASYPCEYTSPPAKRPWMFYPMPIVEESGPSCTLSVMSYNVLSSSYAAPKMYPYCPKEYLDWETRGQSIINEINDYECDVICLQEVELEAFLGFFSPKLEINGYIGIFAPKSRARTMSDTKRRLVDGCAIFWKTEKFTLVSQQLIEFNQLAIKNNAGCKDMLNRVMTRDNIGLFAVLKTTAAAWQDGLPKKSSDVEQLILVANTHLHWNPEFCDVKVLQAMMLAREIERMLETVSSVSEQADNKTFASSDIKLLLCGDFNSKTDSGKFSFKNIKNLILITRVS